MSEITEFLHMGGYGLYVWTSYALSAVVLYVNYLVPIRRERKLIQKLSKLQASKSG